MSETLNAERGSAIASPTCEGVMPTTSSRFRVAWRLVYEAITYVAPLNQHDERAMKYRSVNPLLRNAIPQYTPFQTEFI
jgi:hypothetical protein